MSNSLINAALSARKTEQELLSDASVSDFVMEVFNMTMPSGLPSTLFVERPKLPSTACILGEMVPRARPKHGRLAPLKTKVHKSCPSASSAEGDSETRESTPRSGRTRIRTQDGVRDFLRSRSADIQAKKKKDSLQPAPPKSPVAPSAPQTPQERKSNAFKKVARATSFFGSHRSSSGAFTDDAQLAPTSPTSDDMGAGGGDQSPTSRLSPRRRGALAPSRNDTSDLGKFTDEPEDFRAEKPRMSMHKQFDFKPPGTMAYRMKRLEEKRSAKAKEDKSKWSQESKTRRFEEIPEKERAALTDAFARFDIDRSGYLDHSEVIACLREFGLNGRNAVEKQEILGVCVEATLCNDEERDLPLAGKAESVKINTLFELALNVVPRVRQALAELRSDELLKEFFKFDADGSGKLSQKEIQELAREMGFDPRGMQCDDEHGEVDFPAFELMIVRARERLERTCRERERHVQKVANLSEKSFQKFRKDLVPLYDVFVRHDLDNSGFLIKSELMSMLQESGLAPRTAHEKTDMGAVFAAESDEEINFNDFLEIVLEIRFYRKDKAKDMSLERFQRYDRDKSGSLTIGELSRLLADVGLAPVNHGEQEEIANLICAVDEDGSGVIDFPEFQELCQRIDEKLRSFRFEEEMEYAMRLGFTEVQMRDLHQVFSSLDTDSSRKLDADEVRIGLAMMNKTVSHRVFEDTFRKVDVDGSGELDFMEYLEFMKLIIDLQGPMANAEESTKLAQKPKDLEMRVLRRVLEYFRLSKQYIQSLQREELVNIFCEYLGVKPDQNLQTALEVKTLGELFEVVQERDLAMQKECV